jgi:lipid-binding SYLF domain-containing protein
MLKRFASLVALLALSVVAAPAFADEYTDTINVFRNAGQSGRMFSHAYGYAVFPTVGKGGFVVGAAHGDGRVYEKGKYIGDTSMTQVSVGAQIGGQAYSMIIFFENKAALDTFTTGNFEFGADASAVAITAAADAKATTQGASASASVSKDDARTAANYYKGMRIYTVAKGGLMVQAAVAGAKFNFKRR